MIVELFVVGYAYVWAFIAYKVFKGNESTLGPHQ
jgi:hypothetical protein